MDPPDFNEIKKLVAEMMDAYKVYRQKRELLREMGVETQLPSEHEATWRYTAGGKWRDPEYKEDEEEK